MVVQVIVVGYALGIGGDKHIVFDRNPSYYHEKRAVPHEMYPVSDGEYFGMYGNCFLTDWSAGDIFLPSFMEGGHELGSAEVDEPVFCRLYGKIGYKHVPFSRFVVRKSPWLSVAR